MAEEDLTKVLFEKVPYLLVCLDEYYRNNAKAHPNIGGSYYPPITDGDKAFKVTDSPDLILNKIRSQKKFAGALINYQDKSVCVKKALVDIITENLIVDQVGFITLENSLIGIKISNLYFIKFVEFSINERP
jgi:hypothetical protein